MLGYKPANAMGTVKRFILSESASLRATVAELKADNLKLAMGITEDVSESQSFPAYEGDPESSYFPASNSSYDVLTFGGKKTVDELPIRFVHERPNGRQIVIVLYKAVSNQQLKVPFSDTDLTMHDLVFEALHITDRDAGDQIGFIAEQIEVTEEDLTLEDAEPETLEPTLDTPVWNSPVVVTNCTTEQHIIDGLCPAIGTWHTLSVDPVTDAVEYYFSDVNDPSRNSGWVSDPDCQLEVLDDTIDYQYVCKARDASNGESYWSSMLMHEADGSYNLAPPVPAWDAPVVQSICSTEQDVDDGFCPAIGTWHGLSVGAVTDPDGDTVEYYFENKYNQSINSGWTTSTYVQLEVPDSGEQYYRCKSRDSKGNESSWGTDIAWIP